jgi:hypothetical protein
LRRGCAAKEKFSPRGEAAGGKKSWPSPGALRLDWASNFKKHFLKNTFKKRKKKSS